jgi:hypothetical protein
MDWRLQHSMVENRALKPRCSLQGSCKMQQKRGSGESPSAIFNSICCNGLG